MSNNCDVFLVRASRGAVREHPEKQGLTQSVAGEERR